MIDWIREPRFELINGGSYNRFICTSYGIVRIDNKDILIPTGWRTDMTSVPAWGRGFVPQLGAHAPAVLVHDRLLDLGYPRKEARRNMIEQLDLLPRVKWWRKWLLINGVRLYDMKAAFHTLDLIPGRW
jgi:hypothetical protein